LHTQTSLLDSDRLLRRDSDSQKARRVINLHTAISGHRVRRIRPTSQPPCSHLRLSVTQRGRMGACLLVAGYAKINSINILAAAPPRALREQSAQIKQTRVECGLPRWSRRPVERLTRDQCRPLPYMRPHHRQPVYTTLDTLIKRRHTSAWPKRDYRWPHPRSPRAPARPTPQSSGR